MGDLFTEDKNLGRKSITQQIRNSRTDHQVSPRSLRFRLDKTARVGELIALRRCNIDCIWCHHDYFNYNNTFALSNHQMSTAVVKVINAAKANQNVVRISGDGEPTLVGSRELTDLIMSIKAIPQVQSVNLTTNGVLLGEMADELRGAGLTSVSVSLNSLTRDGYIKYARHNNLKDVLASIRITMQVGIPIKVNVIYTKLNEEEIEDYEKFSIEHKCIPIKFFDLLVGNTDYNSIYLPLEHLEKQIERRASAFSETITPYPKKTYILKSGAYFELKTAGRINTCPNINCRKRPLCLEGCRHSVRIGLDGILRPCGIRSDNVVDLFNSKTRDFDIKEALKSGGKIVS